MRSGRRSQALKVVLTGAIAVALSAPAKADDREPDARLRPDPERKIVAAIEAAFQTGWFGNQIRFEKHSGLEYRRALRVGGRDCILAVQGPVVGRRAYGLGFELRF